MIASDHAPHTKAEKSQSFPNAPSGVPGVETMVPLLMAEMLDRRITLPSLIQKTSTAPAKLIGIPSAGYTPGDRADFAIYPQTTVSVEPEHLHSKCDWTPYEGFRAVFPVTVIRGGEIVYDHGEFCRKEPVWFAGRGRIQ